ncbi:MAG: Eco57I restriction-modification methylase domain-containing protein [archaeon]
MLNEEKYNPDVLETLSNLSNDEVFTHPDLANDILDLLPQNIWTDKTVKFLDPVSKTGVFLREITKRLDKGLEDQIKDKQERINHILSNQVYGIAITELTSLISRRTVYCSKKANGKYSIATNFSSPEGNIYFEHIQHTWENNKCIYCGINKKILNRSEDYESHAYQFIHDHLPKEIKNMKFDVIVGNPPYQLSDGGAQASAKPLYHEFVKQAKKLNPSYLTMIIPSRWMLGGKGLSEFREEMLNDTRIKVLHDFVNASECFPNVEIKGGVCYFLWDKNYDGKANIFLHNNGKIVEKSERYLVEKDLKTYFRYTESISIVKKIAEETEYFDNIISSRKPFLFPTNFKDYTKNKTETRQIKIYGYKFKGYVSEKQIKKNNDAVMKWKVFVPYAIGSGKTSEDRIKPFIGEPGSVCTETYLMVGPFETKDQAKNVQSYITTQFFHFLVGINKITQHATSKVYKYVPIVDFSKKWTDEMLYEKYGLTDKEINFIKESVGKLDNSGDSK